MTPEQLLKLREPFAANQIGKLPKPKSKDSPKGHCNECGGWHGLPAVHLDYVGHAVTTARLLDVDPEWTWEPLAVGANGEPLFVSGGLWIKLTIAGVTRIGFGDGQSPKECIGDAIRNAAMRFGVALDLWAKEDLEAAKPEEKPTDGKAAQKSRRAENTVVDTAEAENVLLALVLAKNGDVEAVKAAIEAERSTSEFVAWLAFQRDWWNTYEPAEAAA